MRANHHQYHILTLNFGYAERLLGEDLGEWIVTGPGVAPTKCYSGGKITGVKYPVLKRLYNALEESDNHTAAVLWVGNDDGRSFDCTLSRHDEMLYVDKFAEHSAARSIFAEVSGYNNCDIAVALWHGPDQSEPSDMDVVYKVISALMDLKHCAFFDYDNVYEQYDYTITVDDCELRCLHIGFDTESG